MYFNKCKTLEELKAEYKRLALLYHPDRGGDLETMKAINAEYDEAFPRLKNIHKNRNGKMYQKESNEPPDEFKDLINQLLKMQGVVVEIIGCFVWLSGNTKAHKDKLHKLGFKWHNKKSMWYKAPEGYRRHGSREYDIDTIRNMYGNKKYSSEETKETKETKEITA